MDGQNKNNKSLIWIAVVVILALLGYGIYKFTNGTSGAIDNSNTNTNNETTTTATTSANQMEDGTVSDAKNKYKDGTYTAEGDYFSPGGAESLGVTITLEDDVIVDASVKSNAFRPNSIHYQGLFISGYKSLVIGKNIDSVQLDKVSGSSLAPKGFNDALAKIKAEAQA